MLQENAIGNGVSNQYKIHVINYTIEINSVNSTNFNLICFSRKIQKFSFGISQPLEIV